MSGNVAAVDSFVPKIEKLMKDENFTPDQIYNCDETGLYWKALPEKTLAAVNETSAPGRKRMKNRITVLACSNASGSHKLELAVVGKSKNPRCLKNVKKSALPVHYLNQRNAWMDCNLFSKWFFDIFVPAVKSWQEKEHLNGALLLFDNCPAHPEDNSMKSGNIRCLFLPPNTTALLQPMDQGVLESLKRRYRKNLIRKLLFEGDSETGAVSIIEFWKTVSIKDCIYMISDAWESIPQSTLTRSWRKLLPTFSTGADENATDIVNDSVTEFSSLFSKMKGFENCGDREVTDWLNCDVEDAGFQLLNDEELIAEVRNSPKEEEDDDDDENENDSGFNKISNNDAFECFSKGLLWLEQQEQCDSSELMLLKKLRDRAARQRMANLRQMKLPFKPL